MIFSKAARFSGKPTVSWMLRIVGRRSLVCGAAAVTEAGWPASDNPQRLESAEEGRCAMGI